MKLCIRLMAAVCLLVLAQACVAHDSSDRNPDSLQGITSVYVQVKDKSKISGMPSDSLLKSQFENLLQTLCQLQIAPSSTPGGAEVRVDLLTIPVIDLKSKKIEKTLALVRTSVWRPVVLTLSDGTTPDTTKPPLKMTAWVATTITDPTADPQLTTAINNHAKILQSSLRAGGSLQPLPPGFSEGFFQSRLPLFKPKLETKVNHALNGTATTMVGIPPTPVTVAIAAHVAVDLSLDNGVLSYQFHGPITVTKKTLTTTTVTPYTAESNNPRTTLDLAGLSTIGGLPTAAITFKNPIPGGSDISMTINDLFH